MDEREPSVNELEDLESEILPTQEICGQLYLNEMGEYVTCVLHAHPPQTGHCDGVDRCEDYCDDPVSDLCYSAGLMDHHGLPTSTFYDYYEVA